MSHDEVLAWAEGMVPVLAERAAEAEELRALPEATIADCDAAGIWLLVVPPDRGGYGHGLRTLCEMSRILAHGCMSTAWTVSFLTLHNWFVYRASEGTQAAVLGDRPYVRMASPLAPGGHAEVAEGGYRLSGTWAWASGVVHSDWVSVMSFVAPPPGAPAGAGPVARVFLLPVDQVDVLDVWHTSGMRGTGSHEVRVDGLFVPEAHTMTLDALRGEEPPGALLRPDRPFLRYPMSPVLCLYAAATAVGGAEAAVDGFRDLISRRVLAHSVGDRQIDQPTSQARLGQARAAVRASRAVWREAIAELTDAYESGHPIPREQRGGFRLAAANAVRLAREAVDICATGSGASQYHEAVPFQRIERDLAVLKGHVVYDWDRVTRLAGSLELGLPPGPTDLL